MQRTRAESNERVTSNIKQPLCCVDLTDSALAVVGSVWPGGMFDGASDVTDDGEICRLCGSGADAARSSAAELQAWLVGWWIGIFLWAGHRRWRGRLWGCHDALVVPSRGLLLWVLMSDESPAVRRWPS